MAATGARAKARAERDRLAAIVAEKQAADRVRSARRRALRTRATGWLPRRGPRPTGVLAQRRRRNVRITFAIFLLLNLVVWLVLPEWGARFGALAVSLLVGPVFYAVAFRR